MVTEAEIMKNPDFGGHFEKMARRGSKDPSNFKINVIFVFFRPNGHKMTPFAKIFFDIPTLSGPHPLIFGSICLTR